MRNLPVKVSEKEIDEMFKVADVDNDGKIGYKDFQKMVNPPKPPEKPKPTKAEFRTQFRVQSEDDLREFISHQEYQLEMETRLKVEEQIQDKNSVSVDVNASCYSESLFPSASQSP